MTDGQVLKWEVFKTDKERLRYLALLEEYENCFVTEREDFYQSFNNSPESEFLKSYNFWMSLPDEKVYEELEVNFLGAVRVLQACMKGLKKSDQASVVLYSTVAVQMGMGFHAGIASAKGAIEGLTRSLAAEWAGS